MTDQDFIIKTISLAEHAAKKGNLPYACILVDQNGTILLEGENTVFTECDLIGHAEINLIREASKRFEIEQLKEATIYTSDEPCAMCSSAIYWSGIRKLVFGLSKSRFYQEFGRDNPDWDFELSASYVLSFGARKTDVIGPILEEDVLAMHRRTIKSKQLI